MEAVGRPVEAAVAGSCEQSEVHDRQAITVARGHAARVRVGVWRADLLGRWCARFAAPALSGSFFGISAGGPYEVGVVPGHAVR